MTSAPKSTDQELESASLSPLPAELQRGLIAVAFFGFLSLIASVTLFVILTYRIVSWRRKSNRPTSQFVLLIYNLVIADIQQSISFMLAVVWLSKDGIEVGTPTCWAQGWFVSVGDLASGVWCFAIGLHTFASVLFNYRLSPPKFYACIFAGWAFVYGCNIIAVAMHKNIYVRAGPWVSSSPR
jgi:G protein-coupled glucose receptor regulating Gpa2